MSSRAPRGQRPAALLALLAVLAVGHATVTVETFRSAAREPTVPVTVLLVVVVFLLVQNRIDRRGPKLAAAPVEAEPELVLGPVLRTTTLDHRPDTGGATA